MTITSTPWGAPQQTTEIAPGITSVETASHGGIHLAPHLIALVPLSWRLARFGAQGTATSPWFEEDCDWAMVALTFPGAFDERTVERAKGIYNAWIAPKLRELV